MTATSGPQYTKINKWTYSYKHFKEGLEKWLSDWEHFHLFPRAWIWSPACTSGGSHSITCNSSSRESNNLFWPPRIHICLILNKDTYVNIKINLLKYFKNFFFKIANIHFNEEFFPQPYKACSKQDSTSLVASHTMWLLSFRREWNDSLL